MFKLFFATLIFFSMNVTATQPSKREACAAFTNAAFANLSTDERLKLSLVSMNISYALGYDEATLNKLQERLLVKIQNHEASLDGIERVALFGCSADMDADEIAPMKAFCESILL